MLLVLLGLIGPCSLASPAQAAPEFELSSPELLAMLPPVHPSPVVKIDHSGRRQKGEASYYAPSFQGKKMANGEKFNGNSNVAASMSLPFGTVARVTNLKNGKSAVVKIQDRGPWTKGRLVDLTPKIAEKLDLKHDGVAPVIISPILVPQPDGSTKPGAGASTRSRLLDEAEVARVKQQILAKDARAKQQAAALK